MNVEYFRTAKKSYMIVKEADFPFEEYELKMILQNEIPCLLHFQVMISDGKVEYWYDVTGMQSLEKQYTLSPAGEKSLRFLLQSLMDMKSSMEDYLLNDANIDYSADMVYFDRFSDRIRFCYIPGFCGQKSMGLKGLFEDILQRLDHSDPVAVKLGYEMYERCAQSDFVIGDCIECLRIGKKEEIPEQIRMNEEEDDEDYALNVIRRAENREWDEDARDSDIQQKDAVPEKGFRHKRRKEKRKKVHYGKILEEEHEVLYAAENIEKGGHTDFFSDEDMRKTWELIYRGDGMEADLRPASFPYLIGTDAQQADGVLQSRTVSRLHARLLLQDERLYAEDFNCSNGSYLYQRLLPRNTPVELHEGDRIVFATEEYMVYGRRVPGSVGRAGKSLIW
ncbi:MAG: FHA domain-containing protein [Clostridiales bacterium]|nr:FHA domain-containing protein [Clostridiales bacterium]